MMELLTNLQTESCGYTLDVFTSKEGIMLVQWVWSSPVGAKKDKAVISFLKQLEILGFSPSDASDFEVGVTNGIEKVPHCPFQPKACPGEHFIASGSGLA